LREAIADRLYRSKEIRVDHDGLSMEDLCRYERTVVIRKWPRRIEKCRFCHVAFDVNRQSLEGRSTEYDQSYFEQTTKLRGELFLDRFPYLVCRTVFMWGVNAYAFRLPNRRLLDVGCGVGFMLKLMQFFDMEVEGIEQSAWAVDYCKRELGIDSIRQGTIEEAGYPSEHFGMVTLIHVLEHLYDPVPTLRECFRVLAPGGIFYGEAPHSEVFRLDYAIEDQYWFYSIPALRYLLSCIGFREILITDGSREARLHNVPFLSFRALKPVACP